MRCPYCHHMDSKVLDSRATDEGASIRRRRECERCGRRFTTYERWEETPLMVIKKDGRREPFQRQKILTGLMKACEKRPIPVAVLEQIVDDIEREARQRGDTEITSRQIGERVMEALRGIDEVAYVRFASVYREFRDLTALLGEVQKLVRRE
ncbi:MAG: transcriptional regulator NrdR [Bacillota bacterium]|nr:transcriptional regulator NrdR [Bacillota bacterium]REJ37112.1 MAG: transcriptional regulator NrdR [Bacillota bacterium]